MKAYPVTVLCRVMRVSRSGFYGYLSRLENPRINGFQKLLEQQARCFFEKYKKTFGSRRLVEKLKKEGYPVGRYRVRRLMRKLGLVARTPKRYRVTTDSRHAYAVAPNIVNRQFTVDAPNKVWTADITYVWTLEG
jgi:hypothetical protein